MHGWLHAVLLNLSMGGSSVAVTPTVSTFGVGWYASDNGLTYNSSGPHALHIDELRRYWMDFQAMAEIIGGDALTGLPTVTITDGTVSGPAISGARALVTIGDLPAAGDYAVTFQVNTLGGSIFSRSGWITTPDRGTIVTATPGSGPVPTYPAVGWVATNDGLVYAVGGPHRKAPTEVRRYWMDFQAMDEIQAGDTITLTTSLTPPTIGCSPAGLSFANLTVDVATNRVYVDISAGDATVEYLVVFGMTTSGGAIISREGVLRVVVL